MDGTQHCSVRSSKRKKKCIIPDPNKALELSLVELSLVVRFAFQEFFEEKLFNQACCFYSLKQSLTWKLLDAWAWLWWNHSIVKNPEGPYFYLGRCRGLTIVHHTICLRHPKPTGNMRANQPHPLPLRGFNTSTLGKHKQFSPRCIAHPLQRDVHWAVKMSCSV